jgi:hypothetical protein
VKLSRILLLVEAEVADVPFRSDTAAERGRDFAWSRAVLPAGLDHANLSKYCFETCFQDTPERPVRDRASEEPPRIVRRRYIRASIFSTRRSPICPFAISTIANTSNSPVQTIKPSTQALPARRASRNQPGRSHRDQPPITSRRGSSLQKLLSAVLQPVHWATETPPRACLNRITSPPFYPSFEIKVKNRAGFSREESTRQIASRLDMVIASDNERT